MQTVSFVQFYPDQLQNARGKYVLQAEVIRDSKFVRIKIMIIIKQYNSVGNHSDSEQCIGKNGALNSKSYWVAFFYMSFLTWILGMIIESNMMCTLTWIGITFHLSDTSCLQNSERLLCWKKLEAAAFKTANIL